MSRASSPLVRAGADRFVAAELDGLGLWPGPGVGADGQVSPRPADVAAIGTTAPKALQGTLLAKAMGEEGFTRRSATPWPGPAELFADASWQLGVVLSPWKREVGMGCALLAASAAATGVVDTVLRSPKGTVGFNTNTWAAQCALEVLLGATTPERVLLLGAGGSSRSVALAVRRAWPACALVVAARSVHSAEELAGAFGGEVLEGAAARPDWDNGWDVVVNTTTWGETDASEQEPFAIDLAGVFVPGGRLFDLNNRISALQHQALADGCAVVSGGVMQRVTNACRAALLAYAVPAGRGAATAS
ncbi:MAG: hypothetical protein JWM85_3363 [Acidimicrobiaceae bacterium]|nr:hypothetical protein [Acidimicrobiaceae bacterium]